MQLTQGQLDILRTFELFRTLFKLEFQMRLSKEIEDMLFAVAPYQMYPESWND